MMNQIAKNIYRYRKEKGLTQERLAHSLGITHQAISKWENEQAMPDITLLPAISKILEVSIDKLLGYVSHDKQITIYEKAYETPDYYWGFQPNADCYQILEYIPPIRNVKLLDIGCGEGRNAVFFARNGYDVTAFDISDAGIEKTKRLADHVGVEVKVFKADLLDFRLNTHFDILFSSGVLHYISLKYREELFQNYKDYTHPGGMHFFNVFVQKPFIPPPPENEPNHHDWRSGELLSHYHDWLIESSSEDIMNCNSSGIPHRHAMNRVVARKI
ncbi:methyltransferase domain-containing protein [Thermoactinomyces sp. DSM 45892]|uniref:methyltransferase domain-containing protein n=1 Tax=Thermoactinomyces sp. DSM 45892 TaxID=1882753 RepID=UPI0008986461|nr:methyltransferase domain-containing protein [Thermoactinomyces sp. DSM 45892]SDY58795.1 Transcriptional regulator, contains XRE-family HTH domain [Thermoactinomyces sp. DSM 45892]